MRSPKALADLLGAEIVQADLMKRETAFDNLNILLNAVLSLFLLASLILVFESLGLLTRNSVYKEILSTKKFFLQEVSRKEWQRMGGRCNAGSNENSQAEACCSLPGSEYGGWCLAVYIIVAHNAFAHMIRT
jgi:hypothetical protein